jgi:hypothetical protein
MNRRDFGKAALAVAATAVVAPAALAAEPSAILDCIVIDYETDKLRWRPLEHPDFSGHTFEYENTGEQTKHRHFEFLRADGLVMGAGTRIEHWTAFYDHSENEFQHLFKPVTTKRFDHAEFLRYVEDVRYYLNGRIVPPDQLA